MHIKFHYINNAVEYKNIVMDALLMPRKKKLKKQAHYIESAKTDPKVLVAPNGGSSKVCHCGNEVPVLLCANPSGGFCAMLPVFSRNKLHSFSPPIAEKNVRFSP